ncbi:MAG: hypothetical protein J0H83_17905 [Candidatus Melainabacteria bacterium]|jgi:hypothetical protein|nr:hypothetical protein [Candidatus Melainabacteria bacterium]
MGTKKISAAALMALREALSVVYWYKQDLERFLRACLYDTPLITHLNWNAYKREIVSELVERLAKNEPANQDALLRLMIEVSQITDFSHLAKLDGGAEKVKKAKDAVVALRQQIKGLDELLRDQKAIEETRARHHSHQKKISGVVSALEQLNTEFKALIRETNPHKRGYKLEKILKGLFDVFDLDPRASFKIIGEQIDGAFTFDNTDYLLEAKWQRNPVNVGDLDRLQAKVSRKLDNTLGLYVSVNGYSEDGLEAFKYDRPKLYLVDGADLMAVLENRIDLQSLLKRKKREASQTGNIYLRISEII